MKNKKFYRLEIYDPKEREVTTNQGENLDELAKHVSDEVIKYEFLRRFSDLAKAMEENEE